MQNNESIFFALLVISLGLYFLYQISKKFPKVASFFFFEKSQQNQCVSLFECFRSPMILKRLGFTILIVLIYKLLSLIKIPFINDSPVNFLLMKFSPTPVVLSIFSYGLTSYLGASIFLQVLSFFIPYFKGIYFEGQASRITLLKHTTILAFILCAFYSAFAMRIMPIYDPVILFYPLSVLLVLAGLALTLWLANLITRYGVGHGVTVLYSSAVLISLIQHASKNLTPFSQDIHTGSFGSFFIWFISSVYVTVLAIYMTRWKKNIALSDKNLALPMRLSSAGVQPLIWSVGTIALMLGLFFFVITNRQLDILYFLDKAHRIPDYIFSVFMLFLISYAYYKFLFTSKYIEKLFSKFGFSHDYSVFLGQIKKTSFLAGFYFSILFVLPFGLAQIFNLKVFPISGGAILIIAGGFFSVIQRIKAIQLIKTSGCDKLCHVASDEIEAEIKKAYLAEHQIECQIEPLTFTWGLPIRTALDEYRMFVSAENQSKASELLS